MREIVKYILSLVTHRMVVLLFVIVFAFSILVARLFQMQVVNGQKFDEEFELKVLRDVAIDGRRGNIYDRNGVPLTENQISYSVTYDTGVYTKSQVQDLLTFSRILLRNGEYLNIDFPIFLNENGEYRYKPELSETRISRFQKDLFEKENVSAVDAMDALSVRWFKKSFADEASFCLPKGSIWCRCVMQFGQMAFISLFPKKLLAISNRKLWQSFRKTEKSCRAFKL